VKCARFIEKEFQMSPAAPFLITLLHRVKAIVRRVRRPAAERGQVVTAGISGDGVLSPEMRGVVECWMSAKLRALSALMRRIEAGEVPVLSVREKLGAKREHAASMRDAVSPEERLPRGLGWMCAFGPNVRGDGKAFAAFLSEPTMRAMVLTAPERMAKLISPILTATGERKPEWFPTVARRVKNPLHSCDPADPVWLGAEKSSPVPESSQGMTPGSLPPDGVGELSDDRLVKPGDDDLIIARTTSNPEMILAPPQYRSRTQPALSSAAFGCTDCCAVDFQKIRHFVHGLCTTISLRYRNLKWYCRS
jgi:hypothetical protein